MAGVEVKAYAVVRDEEWYGPYTSKATADGYAKEFGGRVVELVQAELLTNMCKTIDEQMVVLGREIDRIQSERDAALNRAIGAEAAAKGERARIVQWLRADAAADTNAVSAAITRHIADEIEEGHHHSKALAETEEP